MPDAPIAQEFGQETLKGLRDFPEKVGFFVRMTKRRGSKYRRAPRREEKRREEKRREEKRREEERRGEERRGEERRGEERRGEERRGEERRGEERGKVVLPAMLQSTVMPAPNRYFADAALRKKKNYRSATSPRYCVIDAAQNTASEIATDCAPRPE
nr:hypothetical protein [Paraburkholderia sp. BL8N3]